MNRDELRGKARSIKGKMKRATGDLTGDERLRSEGQSDEIRGKAQETYGRARRKVGKAIEDIGEDMKR